jgi:hypothetical protein
MEKPSGGAQYNRLGAFLWLLKGRHLDSVRLAVL